MEKSLLSLSVNCVFMGLHFTVAFMYVCVLKDGLHNVCF